MINGINSIYNDYEELIIKNDKLSEENRKLKYSQKLLESQNKTFRKIENNLKEELEKREELIREKENEIARLKALLNMDGTNHCIPTSQTPINKKKVIPNTREKRGLSKGGQKGHAKSKLNKFEDNES